MTRAELLARLTQRAKDAERIGATAPVAAVLRDVLAEMETVDGVPTAAPPDKLISLEDAGAQLGVSARWLREHRPPYVVALSRKVFKVSTTKLAAYLRRAE